MDIFVTGATGVLGRPVVRKLVAAGHRVRGLSRSPDNAALLAKLGVEPVAADFFDQAALETAVAGCDTILHLATRIPPTSQARRASAWSENDRIRREGTRNLVAAAVLTGVRSFIYPSFAFVYPDSGDAWIDAATTPAAPDGIRASTLDAEAAVARFAADGRRGVSLRMAAFYDPEAPSTQDQLRLARLGIAPLPGRPGGYFPTIWVDDAAAALITALAQAPSGVYDVVDDEPLRRAELARAFAQTVGRRRLRFLPGWVMRLVGGVGSEALSPSLRISNRRFKEATGWAPRVRDARVGCALLAEASAGPQDRPPLTRRDDAAAPE
jgi:nucleoside-diphosphate-sugar epimerase